MQPPIPEWLGVSKESRAVFVARFMRWMADYLDQGTANEEKDPWKGATNQLIEMIEQDPEIVLKLHIASHDTASILIGFIQTIEALTRAIRTPEGKAEVLAMVRVLNIREKAKNAKSN